MCSAYRDVFDLPPKKLERCILEVYGSDSNMIFLIIILCPINTYDSLLEKHELSHRQWHQNLFLVGNTAHPWSWLTRHYRRPEIIER